MAQVASEEQIMPSAMQRKVSHAFTLVELLVVIGIIAVLISILLPSLSKARQAAMRVQCLSNLRQLSMAVLMYTTDSKGALPYREKNSFDWWSRVGLTNHPNALGANAPSSGTIPMVPSAKTGTAWHCPFAADLLGNWNTWDYQIQYGMNYRLVAVYWPYPPSGWSNTVVNYWDFYGKVPPKANRTLGARTVLLGDNSCYIDDWGQPGRFLWYGLIYGQYDPGTQHSNWQAEPCWPANSIFCSAENIPLTMHGGVANLSFMDGHVESFSRWKSSEMKPLFDFPGQMGW